MSRLGRCSSKGCQVRWRDGEDRPCPEHAQDTPATYTQPVARPAQRPARPPTGMKEST